MFRKKEVLYKESEWLRGLKEAEEFMKVGWRYSEKMSTYHNTYFVHPEGGSHGWSGFDSSFHRGMYDYIKHRELNGEVYEGI